MPDYMSANMDPIVNAIKGFGEGLAGNALKKVQIDRQLGRDIYEAARTEAATNWDKSRTAHQNLKTRNLEELSALFNPGALSGEERTMLGAAAKLGGTSLNDVMKSVGTRHLTGFKDDQYRRGNPATQLSVAIEKPVMPYQMDADTGAILNRMDGTSTVNQAVLAASKFLRGNPVQGGGSSRPRIASPSELVTVFSDVIEEKDAFGNTVRRTVRNDKALNEFIAFSHQNGIPMTQENAWLYRVGLLVGEMANQPVPVSSVQATAPVQAPDEKPADVLPGTQAVRDVKRTVSPDMAAGLEMIRQKLRSGRYLNDEEALNALRMLGFE